MRYGTATGGAIVGWILAIIAMFLADGAFKGTRRIFKMRTLAEAESERADPGDTFIAERPSNGPSSTLVRKNFFINSLLVAVFVFVIWSLLQVSTGERLGSAAAPAGIFVLYMVVSSLVNRVMWHMQETRKELDQLHSRLAALSSAVNWRYDYRKGRDALRELQRGAVQARGWWAMSPGALAESPAGLAKSRPGQQAPERVVGAAVTSLDQGLHSRAVRVASDMWPRIWAITQLASPSEAVPAVVGREGRTARGCRQGSIPSCAAARPAGSRLRETETRALSP